MTLYLNQLIPERGSKDYQLDLGLGAKFCHQTLILDKSVNLLKPCVIPQKGSIPLAKHFNIL